MENIPSAVPENRGGNKGQRLTKVEWQLLFAAATAFILIGREENN
jgi:hypothetical protein